MSAPRHKLLARQIRRVFGPDGAPPAEMDRLLDLVDDAYRTADEDRRLVERSLELTSRELHERNARMNAFFAHAPFSMGMARAEGEEVILLSGSPATARDLGVTILRSTPLSETRVPPAVYATWLGAVRRARTSTVPERFEYRVEAGTTSTRVYAVTIAALQDWGEPPSVCYVVEDVTERAELFQQLAQRDRLASVGTLAAGVAHEVNNPLTYVLTNLTYAVEHLTRLRAHPDPSVAAALIEPLEALEDSAIGARRVHSLVLDLTAFSRADTSRPTAIDLRRVIEFATKFAGADIRRRAQLVVDVRPTPLVVGDETRLGQVLLNLLVNAVEAIPGREPSRHEVSVRCDVDSMGRPFVDITDSGRGIPPDVLPRIFDPFFTMRAEGGGTGLGLSLVKTIMRGFGGDITVLRTQPGRGTTFRVTFVPALGESDVNAPSTPPASGAVRGRILVVDDDANVRNAMSRILGHQHDLVMESGGSEALRRLLTDRTFDLVLCDLRMPGIDGVEVFERAIEGTPLAPRFRIVTADASDPSLATLRQRVNVDVIGKPFEPKDLRRCAADAVHAARS